MSEATSTSKCRPASARLGGCVQSIAAAVAHPARVGENHRAARGGQSQPHNTAAGAELEHLQPSPAG